MEGDTTIELIPPNTVPPLTCSTSACTEDDDEHKLQCGGCRRMIHFKCTHLPAYQIQSILNKNSKAKKSSWLCISCVIVPKELAAVVPNRDRLKKERSKRDKQEIERLAAEVTACENIIKAQKLTIEKQKIETEYLQQKIINTDKFIEIEERMSKRMDELKKDLQQSIVTNTKMIQSQAEKSFADVVKQNQTDESCPVKLRTIIKEARIEEQAEERDKQTRKNNIIIHGIEDPKLENDEEMKKRDKQFVDDLLDDIGVNIKIIEIRRIGRLHQPLKGRPIKIVTSAVTEKDKIMKNLGHLKGKDKYTGLSVTEDFTQAERALFKSWAEKAKAKNNEEPRESNFIWRVRGSPKSGLYLKRLIIKDSPPQK